MGNSKACKVGWCLVITTIPILMYLAWSMVILKIETYKIDEVLSNNDTELKDWDGIEQEYIISFNVHDNTSKICDIAGTITILTTSLSSDLNNLKYNLPHLATTFYQFNKIKYCYPISIFHEDLTNETINDLIHYLISRNSYFQYVTIHFIKIKFWIPYHIKNTIGNKILVVHIDKMSDNAEPYVVRHNGLKPWTKRNSFGYYHMCRFWMSLHALNYMKQYRYYMRLDTDSQCNKNMPDYFLYLNNNKNVYYLFNNKHKDTGNVVENLLSVTIKYIENNINVINDKEISQNILQLIKPYHLTIRKDFNHAPRSKYCKNNEWQIVRNVGDFRAFYKKINNGRKCSLFNGNEYHNGYPLKIYGCGANELGYKININKFHSIPTYATNFEVVDLSIFRSTEYNKLIKYLDERGGIYEHRWGDAPMRYLTLNVLLNSNQIEKVIGCIHPSWAPEEWNDH